MSSSSDNPGSMPSTIAATISAVFMAVAIVTVTFTTLLLPVFTTAFADQFVKDDISSASHEYLVEIAEQTLDYCAGYPGAQLPEGSNDKTSFTPDIMDHLDDVAVFFTGVRIAAAIAAAGIAISLLALRRLCRDKGRFRLLLSRALMFSAIAVLALLAVFLVLASINFDALFNGLHSLFFSSGTWTFAFDSLLICALPEEYWMSMGVLWGAEVLVACVVMILVGIHFKKSSARIQRQ